MPRPKSALVPAYTENPFINQITTFKSRKKKISVSTGSQILVDKNTGELTAPTEIVSVHEVDSEQFIKLYTGQLRALFELSPAGFRLMEVIFFQVQNNAMNKDYVYLNVRMAEEYFKETQRPPLSSTTFYRGLRELLEKNILAQSVDSNLYFINPHIFFNGDRVRFITEYRKKRSNTEKLEDAGQQRLAIEE